MIGFKLTLCYQFFQPTVRSPAGNPMRMGYKHRSMHNGQWKKAAPGFRSSVERMVMSNLQWLIRTTAFRIFPPLQFQGKVRIYISTL